MSEKTIEKRKSKKASRRKGSWTWYRNKKISK